MPRLVFTLLLLALLSAWADAQTAPAPLLAADRLRLLHANRTLLEDLLDRGLTLGNAAGKLDRADECRLAMGALTDALNRATDEPAVDADRVAELTDHLADLARTGLAPTLADERARTAAGSPGAARLARIENAAATDLTAVQNQFLLDPRLARSPKLAASRERLAAAAAQVKPKE